MAQSQPSSVERWDRIFVEGHVVTMTEGMGAYGAIRDAAVGTVGDRIAFVGPQTELPAAPGACADVVTSMHGGWMTPGLIDCHTHLVFAGSRVDEFEARLKGASYETIARQGGGIASTVAAVRRATVEDLVAESRPRLRALMNEGVTTVEIKSGYGLALEPEMNQLRAARELGRSEPVRVVTTFLGAHARPPEMVGPLDAYVDAVIGMLDPVQTEGLADAVDAFCEGIGFEPDQVRRIFEAARQHGLPVKLHADQLSDLGGAGLAASFGALSADHLEYTSEAGVTAMADASTVAVLLPGAFLNLNETRKPPIEAFRRGGVPMAVSTDCNPGSSPTTSLPQMMNLACLLFGLTPEESLAGTTRNAARALGLADRIGTIEVGKQADLAVWDIRSPADLSYWTGGGRLRHVVVGGRNRSEPQEPS